MLRLARLHGLSGLCAARLAEHPRRDVVPEAFVAACEADHRATALRNALLLEEAAALSAALRAVGVEHRFFKGIALLGTSYPDLGTRALSDLDLLVHPHALTPTFAVLREREYHSAYPEPMGRARQYGEVEWVAQGAWPEHVRPRVDLHTLSDYTRSHPAADALASLDALLWRGKRLSPRGLPAPAREEHLVVLLLHAAKHIAEVFAAKWYWDLHCLIGDGDLAWEQVRRDLGDYRAGGAGWLLLNALRRDLGSAVPDAVIHELQPHWRVRRMAPLFRLERLLARDRLVGSGAVGIGMRTLWDDRPAVALRSAVSAWWPSEATLRARFPSRAEESLVQLRLRRIAHGVRHTWTNFRERD